MILTIIVYFFFISRIGNFLVLICYKKYQLLGLNSILYSYTPFVRVYVFVLH